MNFIRIVGDGALLTAVVFGASLIEGPCFADKEYNKNRLFSWGIYFLGILISVLEVFFLYRGQENSDYFFWHPYLSWTIANIVYIIYTFFIHRRKQKYYNIRVFFLERVLLWQIIVITTFSGLALSLGWLMKLYIR